jgi:hypothetical protein
MKNLPSPSTAERNQRRKLAYLPPLWPLAIVLAAIALFVVLAR